MSWEEAWEHADSDVEPSTPCPQCGEKMKVISTYYACKCGYVRKCIEHDAIQFCSRAIERLRNLF